MTQQLSAESGRFAQQVHALSGRRAASCYQCGKCSAGCPMASDMAEPPHRVVRFVQLGLRDKALESHAIWLCAGCLTCSTRCPQGFDLAGLMDDLRQLAVSEGHEMPETDVIAFHRAFLEQVYKHGRMSEIGLIGSYKLRTGHLFADIGVAPGMLVRGKLRLLPQRIKGVAEVRKLFEQFGPEGSR